MTINTEASQDEEKKLNYLQRVWKFRRYFVVEAFSFFYLMASILNSIAASNFPVDKACRLNLKYSMEVCSTTLDKSLYGIDCDAFNFEKVEEFGATLEEMAVTDMSPGFNYTVCKAEVGAQKLVANVSGKRAPIIAIFLLIVILFAGGWSARYNKCKACIIMPIIGECLMFLCLLTSAIFFDSISMELGAYAEAIVPSLFGGQTLWFMTIDSYMTISTPEKDRIFRFGVFAMFTAVLTLIGQPLSGLLFNYLGYKMSFVMGFSLNIIGMLYVIFFIKEPKPETPEAIDGNTRQTTNGGTENPAYEITNLDDVPPSSRSVSFQSGTDAVAVIPAPAPLPEKRNFIKDFFDPTLLMDVVKFPMKQRPNNGRMILILLMMAYMFTLGPALGENDFYNRFTYKKLNWNGEDYSIYSTVTSASALAGTFIGTTILSKLLKLSDPLVGFTSAFTTVLSRVLFAFSNDTATFYAGGIADSFASLRAIAMKTIGSSVVGGEELSKMFSIFSICQPIGQFVFVPIYSDIYENTVNTFPGAIFLFTEVFAVPNIIVFIVCYVVVRRRTAQIVKQEKKNLENAHNDDESNAPTKTDNLDITQF